MSIYKLKQHPSFYKDFPHTMEDRTPYTYLIGWSKLGTSYYGVRYGKQCHPSDLFNSTLRHPYYTSSTIVKDFINLNGLPDIIQIRKIFNNTKIAKIWEDQVLVTLMKNENHNLLNIGNMNNFHGCKNGKPKGCKEKLSTKLKKSETQKNYVSITNVKTGKHFRMRKILALPLLLSHEYVYLGTGRKGKKYADDIILKFKLAAQNREIFYCDLCKCNIKGRMNWNRHIDSLVHNKNEPLFQLCMLHIIGVKMKKIYEDNEHIKLRRSLETKDFTLYERENLLYYLHLYQIIHHSPMI